MCVCVVCVSVSGVCMLKGINIYVCGNHLRSL